MSIKKMKIIVTCAIPVILIITIVLFFVLNTLMAQVTETREESTAITALGNEMLHNHNQAVKLMRKFVVSFDADILRQYENLMGDYASLGGKLDGMVEFGLTDIELGKIDRIFELLDACADKEGEAIAAYRAGDLERAIAIIQSDDYTAVDVELVDYTKRLIVEISQRYGEESDAMTARGRTGLIAIAIFFVFSLVSIAVITSWFVKKAYWYENILDNIPFIVSVIDNDMKFTFINKTATDVLERPRDELIGLPCNEVWQSACSACNTPNCGVERHKRGFTRTEYTADGGYFQVTVAALKDKHGKQIGYMEFDQEITEMIAAQKAEAEMVKEIKSISNSFVDASRQIADGSNLLAQGATEQAAAIEELSATITEINTQTDNNAIVSKEAADLSSEIKAYAEKSSVQMDNMMTAVREINDASGKIEKVIKVIEDIAFQTNILALNAAVEAARAGQAGKGFAVVAEEVRNLASKSAEAAKNTGGLISDTVGKAHVGLEIATETAASLEQIVDGISRSAGLVAQIAESSSQQADALGQLTHGIAQVSNVVQQISATAEESAASSEEMSEQATHLQALASGAHAEALPPHDAKNSTPLLPQ